MKSIDLHPVKCSGCFAQLVIGLDENRYSWAYCPQCKSARPLLDIIIEGLRGQIAPPEATNN